jgi:ADP-ribose pyrophosphatase YjhB (NUDIX family)
MLSPEDSFMFARGLRRLAAERFREEAGNSISEGQLHLIGVYSDPAQDPRGHSVSIAYITIERPMDPQPGSDAEGVEWVMDWKKVQLAFNHAEVLSDAANLETGQVHWQRPVLPPVRSGEDEAFWRGLEQKLRRP